MNVHQLIIGSRGSDLALYQANAIRDILVNEYMCEVRIKVIETSGDRIDNVSFDKIEGKGFFTKELEETLLAREIDMAVHSLKDLMTIQPEGLKLGAVGYRVDRRELLLIRKQYRIAEGIIPVKAGATIGTSAARRKAQIAFHNPSLNITDLRGNVPTRVRKLREGKYDAIIIASAGVERLGLDLSDLDVISLDPEVFLPAPAQGILGIQIREHDLPVETIISKLGSLHISREAELERGLLARFHSGCSLPLGVYSEIKGNALKLTAVLGVWDGNAWAGLKRVTVSGYESEQVIDEAYSQLAESKVICG
jgi:hydroxymethylbilane synthase